MKGGVAKKFGRGKGSSHSSSVYSSNLFKTTTDEELEPRDDIEDGLSKAGIKVGDVQVQPTTVAGPTAVEISPESRETEGVPTAVSKVPVAAPALAAPAPPKVKPTHSSQQKQQLHLHAYMPPGPTKETHKNGLISGLWGGAAAAAAIGAVWAGYQWFTKRKEQKDTELAYRRIYGTDNEHFRAHW